MTAHTRLALAALVAAVILVVGIAYVGTRHTTYESDASVAITAATRDPNVLANLLGSFQASGTSGTFVELLSSPDTIKSAGVTNVTVTARAIPDTRAIQVSTNGPKSQVTPALGAIIRAAIARQADVGGVWQLQLLGSPTPPAASGPSKKLLLLATLVLAILGALFVVAVLRGGKAADPRDGQSPELGLVPRGLEPMPLPAPSSARHVLASEADITFHLEGFRYVPASTTTILLQIAGYWRSAVPQALDDPVLLLHTRYVVHALPSVASPDKSPPVAGPDSPLWRESYSAPAEVFYRHQRLALRASPDVVVGLPDPDQHRILSANEREGERLSRHLSSGEGAREITTPPKSPNQTQSTEQTADEPTDGAPGGAASSSLSR